MQGIYRWMLVALLLGTIVTSQVGAEGEETPALGPTPRETLMLEYMNRARADPGGEARRIRARAPDQVKTFTRLSAIDFDTFVVEMEATSPAPPLVFDLKLLKAARAHSRYMVLNKVTGHQEDPAKEGFTGESGNVRTRAAGFLGGVAENAARDYWDVEYGYLAYIIDFRRGAPGGMRPGRGHRNNILDPSSRLVASGRAETKTEIGNCLLFGHGRGRRYLGGVVYTDANGNGCYDLGEGAGGVTVRVEGGPETRTWSSGAYALELADTDACKVAVVWNDLTFTKRCPEGRNNLKVDVVFPAEKTLHRLDAMLEKLEARGRSPTEDRRVLAGALELHEALRGITLADGRAARVERATAEAVTLWTTARDRIRSLVSDGQAEEALTAAKVEERAFRGTPMEVFFDDAVRLATVRRRIGEVPVDVSPAAERKRSRARRQLEKVKQHLVLEEWRDCVDGMLAALGAR